MALAASVVALTFSLSNYLNRNKTAEKNFLLEKELAFYKTMENLNDEFIGTKRFLDSLPLFLFDEKKTCTRDIIPPKCSLIVLFSLNQCQSCLEKVIESIQKNKSLSDTTKAKILFIGNSNSLFEMLRFKQFNKINHSIYVDVIDTVRRHLGIEQLPTTEWILDEKGRVLYAFYPESSQFELMEKFHNRLVKIISAE